MNKNTSNKSEFDKIFQLYDFKIKEQNNQIGQLINSLNQYYSNSLINETESKALRDKLISYATNDLKLQKELDLRDAKVSKLENELKESNQVILKLKEEIQSKNQEMDQKHEMMSELDKKITDLINKMNDKEKEVKRLTDDIKALENKMEDQEKSHEETILNLQRTLSIEINHKKELQSKYGKVNDKLQAAEAKEQELEAAIAKQKAKHDEEFSLLKNEHEKLKSILSYVKNNCTF